MDDASGSVPAGTARALAARFEALHEALLGFAAVCPADGWHAVTHDEGWRAGVTAHHVAAIHYPVIDQVQAMRDGRPLTVTTLADVDRLNEAHVRAHAECTPGEAQAFIEAEGQRVRAWLRTIDDADLDRVADIPFMGGPTTAGRLLQVVLIDLAEGHLRSAQAAAQGREAASPAS